MIDTQKQGQSSASDPTSGADRHHTPDPSAIPRGASASSAAGVFDPVNAPSRQVDCGNFAIHISRDGRWWYRGSPIGRPALVKLFASVLRRDAAGGYWLVTPVERGRITVEDAPFVAVELTVSGEGREQVLSFRTTLDDIVTADESHPIRVGHDDVTQGPQPYITIREGLEARLSRAVFYELVERGMEERVADATRFGVWSKGQFFPLGSLDETA